MVSEWPAIPPTISTFASGVPAADGAGADARIRPFVKQVEVAIRKAGGNPNRIGRSAGKGSGRYNARGRGAKLSFPKEGAGWQRDSSRRMRTPRDAAKALAG